LNKVWIIISIITLVLILLGGLIYGFYLRPINSRVNVPQDGTVYVVKSGDTLSKIARNLEKKRIIPSADVLMLYARMNNNGDKLSIGAFKLEKDMRVKDLPELFSSKRVMSFLLIVPEGLWLTEIAERLEKIKEGLGKEYLYEVTENISEYQKRYPMLGIPDISMEGYLFPDTYFLPFNATGAIVVDLQLKRFVEMSYSEWEKFNADNGLSFYETLILASLVEGEAKVAAERADIAGVYINRLNTKGWKLECDATVIYAIGKRKTRVLFSDLKMDSPYNTYSYEGLPQAPINNPGIKCFEAALKPAEHDYFFYFAKGDGSHAFAKDFKEHQNNIKQYRK